jgi:phage shock protein PspC (stress-responsive transcriptional regulator)
MKKTISINISGIIINIDEDAYDKLEKWLNQISDKYKNEEGGDEIINDIESRVGELLSLGLKNEKKVISIDDIEKVIEVMGRPEQFDQESEENYNFSTISDDSSKETKASKRFFRDEDKKIIAGVCSGIAYYFNIDVGLVRFVFIISSFFSGLGFVLYIIFWALIPSAGTSGQKLEMKGEPVNISNIEKMIKNEFDRVKTNLKQNGYKDKISKFGKELGIIFEKFGKICIAFFNLFSRFLGSIFILIGALAVFVLFLFLFKDYMPNYLQFGDISSGDIPFMEFIPVSLSDGIILTFVFLILLLPLLGIVSAGFKLVNHHKKNRFFNYTFSALWLLVIALTGIIVFHLILNFSTEQSVTKTQSFKYLNGTTLYLKSGIREMSSQNEFQVFDYSVAKNEHGYRLYGKPEYSITKSEGEDIKLNVTYYAKGSNRESAKQHLNEIRFSWYNADSIITCDPYFTVHGNNRLYHRRLVVNLQIPQGAIIYIDPKFSGNIKHVDISDSITTFDIYDRKLLMTDRGLSVINHSFMNVE